MSDFHALTVDQVQRLTPNSVSISFQIPEALKKTFFYKAGQYVTIKHKIDGKELRRAYSISCAPNSEQLTIGIKKVNTFVLVFGNQTPEEVMYSNEIQVLRDSYTNRFFVQHVFSRKHGNSQALFGRIENSTVNLILKNKFKETTFNRFYLCGPKEMIQTVETSLLNNGIAKENILFELFTSDDTENEIAENLDGKTNVSVILDDEEHTLTMDKKELVLDAVLKATIDAPYSCQGGVCSSCIARVVDGKAEMVKNQILTDGEVAEGLILTCQAHPLTPNLKIDYDDV